MNTPHPRLADKPYNVDVFRHQVCVVDRFIRHLALHRALIAAREDGLRRSQVLLSASDSALLMAVVEWCKVFGSAGPNSQIHVSRLPTPASPFDFSSDVRQALELSEGEWGGYINDMRHLRDTYIAHLDINTERRPIPLLDRAEQVAFFYDTWIRRVIAPDPYTEQPLRDLAQIAATLYGEEVSALVCCANGEDFPSV